ncbi:hypothetical protein HDU85_003334 [Gaertneriomyces sp. JEL0708]|nr:hypothetical protein HDU85_003334 [Gaertneriomyces sp. JEL0708]
MSENSPLGSSEQSDDEPKSYSCSVWAAFDKMQLCYTVIPQVKHYYRYGTFRDCSEAREDFQFCLKMKRKSKGEAERLIREREESKYEKKVTERPSRSVWEVNNRDFAER